MNLELFSDENSIYGWPSFFEILKRYIIFLNQNNLSIIYEISGSRGEIELPVIKKKYFSLSFLII